MASSECSLSTGPRALFKVSPGFAVINHCFPITSICIVYKTPGCVTWKQTKNTVGNSAPSAGQPEEIDLARPWSLNLILLCDRACKLTLQPESPASSWRACCRPCKSVVVVVHGVPSRAEGDMAVLWMGPEEGLRCPRTLLLSRMVEKNAGSSSRAGDLQSNCSLRQGLFLSSNGSHTSLLGSADCGSPRNSTASSPLG